MHNIQFSGKKEYTTMELIKMENNRSYHESVYIGEHIFKATQPCFHRHEYMQVNYIASGNGYCEFEDGTARFTQGSCFIIPPFVPHRIVLGEQVRSVKVYEVEFMTDFIFPPSHEIRDMEAYSDFICLGLKENIPQEYSKHIINLEGSAQEKVERIVRDAFDEYQNREPGYETVIRSSILHLLTVLGRKYSSSIQESEADRYKKHRQDVLKVMDYIHKNYDKDITLEELSRLANYSSSYFSSLFKAVTSNSCLEYLNHYRVKKSMELLKNTDKKVIDIAASVGFQNVSNFNRMFKNMIGMSPTDYRKLQ